MLPRTLAEFWCSSSLACLGRVVLLSLFGCEAVSELLIILQLHVLLKHDF